MEAVGLNKLLEEFCCKGEERRNEATVGEGMWVKGGFYVLTGDSLIRICADGDIVADGYTLF